MAGGFQKQPGTFAPTSAKLTKPRQNKKPVVPPEKSIIAHIEHVEHYYIPNICIHLSNVKIKSDKEGLFHLHLVHI